MWEEVMHAVIRNYSGKGAKELFDVIEKNKAEVERVIRPVKGFVEEPSLSGPGRMLVESWW